MLLIKLDAIDSTNDFLKKMTAEKHVADFTVVTTEKQTHGRGQMGAKWETVAGKNLVASILKNKPVVDPSMLFDLNMGVAVSVATALENYNLQNVAVKWPNDIMAGNRKIGGILIENSIKSDGSIVSIIGIGVNVNQIGFDGLPNASSIAEITGAEWDRELLLKRIVENLKENMVIIKREPKMIRLEYAKRLFRKDVPMPFTSPTSKPFMGIIRGVTEGGLLRVEMESGAIDEYNLKEITMLY